MGTPATILDQQQPWAAASQPLGILSADPNADQNDALNQQAQALQQQQAAQMAPATPQGQVLPPAPAGQPDMGHPNTIEAVAAGVHHTRLANMLSKVGDLFGGATSYKLVQNPDGSVDVHPQQSTPGEKWGRAAQVALQGLAHGWAAGQGPGGMARALNAGVQTGTQIATDRTKQANDLSQQYTEQNQKKQLFNANMRLMTLKTGKLIYDQDRQQFLDKETDDDRLNNIAKEAKSTNSTTQTFNTLEDLANAHNDPNNELAQAERENRVLVHHIPTKDNPQKTMITITPRDEMHQQYKQEWTPKIAHLDPADPKKPVTYTDGPTYVGGYHTVEQHNALFADQNLKNEQVEQQRVALLKQDEDRKLARQREQAQIGEAEAGSAAHKAAASLSEAKAKAIGAGSGAYVDPSVSPPDANFPNRAYFPQGEPGIMPYDNPKSGTYKVDPDTVKRENGALNVAHNVDQLKNLFGVDANGNPTRDLTGSVGQALKDMTETQLTGIKDQDSDLGRLVTAVIQIQQGSVAMHGRNAPLVREGIKDTINHFLNSPKAMIAQADQEAQSGQEFIDAAQQRRNYGNMIPEGRRHAVADNWWAQRGARIVDRGGPTREATIEFTKPDKNGQVLRVPQSIAAKIIADKRLGQLNTIETEQ